MSELLLEQKLREQMQNKFRLKPKSKKRKLPFEESNPNNKKIKLSNNGIKKSKQEMMTEFRTLGLMNNNDYKPPIPERNNSWKQQKKKKMNNGRKHRLNDDSQRPKKRRKMNNNDYVNDDDKKTNVEDINIEKLHYV